MITLLSILLKPLQASQPQALFFPVFTIGVWYHECPSRTGRAGTKPLITFINGWAVRLSGHLPIFSTPPFPSPNHAGNKA